MRSTEIFVENMDTGALRCVAPQYFGATHLETRTMGTFYKYHWCYAPADVWFFTYETTSSQPRTYAEGTDDLIPPFRHKKTQLKPP